jgi:hypothetical protein
MNNSTKQTNPKGQAMKKNLLTGYQVAALTNRALDKVGEYPIPPQMVYTYIKKGFIPSHISASGQRVVRLRDAGAFARRFVANRQANRADALAFDTPCGPFVAPSQTKV